MSGFTSTDAYGDGCLATEIQLVGPRYATVDSAGNVFFSDYTNGLIRRVDVSTGVVTAVAGGATASPAATAMCGTLISTDARGDGCLGTAVKLSKPVGLAFSPAGDLYFGDVGYANVRKIAATGGLIPATASGIISNVAGSTSGAYGYAANNASGNIVAATGSYLDDPYDVAFDSAGNLYVSEEFKDAILVVNTNASTTTTVAGVSIPPGTIAKVLGATSGSSTCPNSPASTNGCSYGLSTFNGPANSSEVDALYAAAPDAAGNVYFAGEYYNFIGKISSSDVLTQYAGIQNSGGAKLLRGAPGSFGIGGSFGIAADAIGNVYFTDAFNAVIWRVDTGGTTQYVVGGGGAVCGGATDSYGDGCPGLQATFGSSNSKGFAVASSPGIFGINVDANSNLYVGDSITNLIREVSSGTQFGNVGATSTATQTVDIHFVAGDMPAAVAYAITSGSKNFSIGTASCTINSDNTTDCLLPITATPSGLGAFTGTLGVNSKLSAAIFALSGVGVATPVTRTSVALTAFGSCTGTSTFSTNTPLTFTAAIASTGSPTGSITFYANGVQIGSPQTVANSVASLTYTFATAGTYKVNATYNGDKYYQVSTSSTPATGRKRFAGLCRHADDVPVPDRGGGRDGVVQLHGGADGVCGHHLDGLLGTSGELVLLVQSDDDYGHGMLGEQHGRAQHRDAAGACDDGFVRRDGKRAVVSAQHGCGLRAGAADRSEPATEHASI